MAGKPDQPSLLWDVTDAAQAMRCSEKAIYARVARRTIPFRKDGKRIVFVREELLQFIRDLDGVTLEQAKHNQSVRGL